MGERRVAAEQLGILLILLAIIDITLELLATLATACSSNAKISCSQSEILKVVLLCWNLIASSSFQSFGRE